MSLTMITLQTSLAWVCVEKLMQSSWFKGPAFLWQSDEQLDWLLNEEEAIHLWPGHLEVKKTCHLTESGK